MRTSPKTNRFVIPAKSIISNVFAAVRVGYFLGSRDIRRSNRWTTILIIFIMTLTFLNLIVVRGVLVGLVEGSNTAYRKLYITDLILEPLRLKNYIEQSPEVIKIVSGIPGLQNYSARYLAPATVDYGYRNKVKQTDATESVNVISAGINPEKELAITQLDKRLVKGSFINSSDVDYVVVGASILFKYTPFDSTTVKTLKDVDVGSKIRININGKQREVIIKGVIKTKVESVDLRVYMPESVLRSMMDRYDYNVSEISIKLQKPANDAAVKKYLLANEVGSYAKVSTFDEGVPKFVKDIRVTFDILSNIIGSIGLVVAAITIFIVIFVNAITRRKYIGILKGIGVTAWAIEISYILQGLYYALIGIGIGSVIVFVFLKPYFTTNTINFPFGDGILVADPLDVLVRSVVLFFATMIAGYIPARIVVKQNTLDAILGR